MKMMKVASISVICLALLLCCKGDDSRDKRDTHPKSPHRRQDPDHFIDFINPPEDRVKTDWYAQGQRRIQDAIQAVQRMVELNKPAKNVIFMMGDGLGISTSSAARIYMSQQRNLTGDDSQLSWERMPHMALSKTYAVDTAISDSAATATAMMCGEKTQNSIINCNQDSINGNCNSTKGNELTSILQHSIDEGKWTGLVTTTRVTHASPACTFSSSASRSWEADSDLTEEAMQNGCKDIAAQLIDDARNQKIRVILGGGRENFIPLTQPDPEYPDENGLRADGRDLIQEWQDMKANEGIPENEYAYVNSLVDFDQVDANETEYLMGLFEPSHMQYELEKDEDGFGEPTLVDMVDKAIRILQKSEDGYFLFVESGLVDLAHHANRVKKSLHETVSLSDAVQRALDLTSEEDTLIVVSADHSHVFTMGGSSQDIDTDILTFSDGMVADDDKPYAILGYTNGPGFEFHRIDPDTGLETPRLDLTDLKPIMTDDDDYRADAGIHRGSETHGGEDVAIYARGPMAHLFHGKDMAYMGSMGVAGTQEQSYIGNAMMYASCVGRNQDLCDDVPPICPT